MTDHANIDTRVKLCSPLAHNDVARDAVLSAIKLDA